MEDVDFLENFHMPVISVDDGNAEAFGGRGGMARATWAPQPLCGSPWVLEYLYCHQLPPKTIVGVIEGFRNNCNF